MGYAAVAIGAASAIAGAAMGKKSNGSSTATYTYDAESSRKMAEINQQQQDIANEQWDLYKEIFLPYERNAMAANEQLLPLQNEVTELTLQENIRDTNANREVKDLLRQQQIDEIGLTKPVAEKFYKEVLEGVDPNRRANQAQAEVTQSYNNSTGMLSRDLSRRGISLNSGAGLNALANSNYQMAKDIATARTGAINQAESESFGRLQVGMGARGTATGLPGIQSSGAFANVNPAGYNVENPAQAASQNLSNASQGYGLLANRVMGKTGSWDSTVHDWQSAMGSAGGMVAGYAGGKS